MNRPSRDTWLAIGLVALLAVITIAAALTQTQQAKLPPYASMSNARDGARALWLWLEENDYRAVNTTTGGFAPPPGATITLMLEPTVPVLRQEWAVLDPWIDAGGTLIIAGEGAQTSAAMNHFGFDPRLGGSRAELLSLQMPVMLAPPVTTSARVRARNYLTTNETGFAVLLAMGERPVAVAFGYGEGTVILSSAPFPFSNAGLKEQGNPQLVQNLVNAFHRDGVIWFDEWHHGFQGVQDEVVGPQEWLFQTPAGRSLLYAFAVIFIALALSGRHFGRPIRPVRERVRRAPLEYITAIANLNRRAGHRRFVLNQYHQRLKTELGHRYRLSPALPDDEFVAALAFYNPALDVEALQSLLARLHQPKIGEAELVEVSRQAAQFLDQGR